MMKLLAKIIIVIAVFFGGFYFGQNQALSPSGNGQPVLENKGSDQPPVQAGLDISVNLMLDFGNGQVMTYNEVKLPNDSTVFDLLKKVTAENNLKLQSKDYGELGVFIESINDIENEISGNRFWQYWVNNEYAKIGASSFKLDGGDMVEWKYIMGQID